MNCGLSLQEKPTGKTTILFIVLSCVGMLAVFRGALWGEAIVAPLDAPAALFAKYRWINPGAGEIPRNHYVVDMFDFDLPLTHLAHRSMQDGEFPWWNPYNDGGRTLAMEPHLGVVDPLRFVILQLPEFVSAYNWSRILQCFFSGLTMFALLRFIGFSQFTTVFGALSFQFCGFQSCFFYPYIHSLLYYPLLWLALAKYSRTSPATAVGLGGVVCGAVIVSGSQQSHPYLVLFLGCFVAAYGSCFRRELLTLVAVAGGAMALGCALAAPILIPQLEVFALSSRKMPPAGLGAYMLTGVFSLAGIFPWFTGSFRTLDLGKLFGQSGAAYAVYIGTPAMILAGVALFAGKKSPRAGNPDIRLALLLVLIYFVAICSTPLLKMLYFRSALLAVLGLIVLSGAGLEIISQNAWPNARRMLVWIIGLLCVGVVLSHVFAFFVYPQVKDKVLQIALERDVRNLSLPSSPELRRFQVDNLANEITFKNPEPLIALLGALSLLGLAAAKQKYRQSAAAGVFAFNLLPLLIFSARSLPYSPVDHWKALLSGGPEQRELIEVTGRDLRLLERAPDRLHYTFPGTTPALYGLHSMSGYTSLPLTGPGQVGSPREHNVLYVSERRGEKPRLTVLHTNQVRFVWATNQNRNVSIVRETPNSIQLRIAAGPAGELVRTDTYYPGWEAHKPNGITQRRNSDGFWAFSIPPAATDLVLRYRPSYYRASAGMSVASLGLAAALAVRGLRSRRSTQPEQARPG